MVASPERTSVMNDSVLTQGELSIAVCVRPHHASDGNQLELQVNDRVVVLEKDETGWWGGHKEGDEFTGWFPGVCVMELNDQGQSNLEAATTLTLHVGTKTYAQTDPQPDRVVLVVKCTGTDGNCVDQVEIDKLETTVSQLRSNLARRNNILSTLRLVTTSGKELGSDLDSVAVAEACGLSNQIPKAHASVAVGGTSAAIETAHAGRRRSAVASPQHAAPVDVEARHAGAVTAPAVSQADAPNEATRLVAERKAAVEAQEAAKEAAAAAKAEALRLERELYKLQKQREAEVQAERDNRCLIEEKNKELERQLYALRMEKERGDVELEDRQRRITEFQTLVEKERRASQAAHEQLQRQREQYMSELQEKESEIRTSQESTRRYSQRASLAEDRNRVLAEELGAARADRNSICSGWGVRASVASVLEASNASSNDPLGSRGADERPEPCRRLFSSTVSSANGDEKEPATPPMLASPPHMTLGSAATQAEPRVPPTATAAATSGRRAPLPPGASPQSHYGRQVSAALMGGARKTFEPAAPFGARSESVPRQERGRGCLEATSAAQRRGQSHCSGAAPPRDAEEEPQPGCVASKVREFEQRFASPRRNLPDQDRQFASTPKMAMPTASGARLKSPSVAKVPPRAAATVDMKPLDLKALRLSGVYASDNGTATCTTSIPNSSCHEAAPPIVQPLQNMEPLARCSDHHSSCMDRAIPAIAMQPVREPPSATGGIAVGAGYGRRCPSDVALPASPTDGDAISVKDRVRAFSGKGGQ